jgi:hypothetical protein
LYAPYVLLGMFFFPCSSSFFFLLWHIFHLFFSFFFFLFPFNFRCGGWSCDVVAANDVQQGLLWCWICSSDCGGRYWVKPRGSK